MSAVEECSVLRSPDAESVVVELTTAGCHIDVAASLTEIDCSAATDRDVTAPTDDVAIASAGARCLSPISRRTSIECIPNKVSPALGITPIDIFRDRPAQRRPDADQLQD